eukprot:1189268-Prorocentrum_minimum.AAC.2
MCYRGGAAVVWKRRQAGVGSGSGGEKGLGGFCYINLDSGGVPEGTLCPVCEWVIDSELLDELVDVEVVIPG